MARAKRGKTLERRTYPRKDLLQIVQYTPSSDTSETAIKGVIKNYTCYGLCLIAREPLEDGQEIIVNSIIAPPSKRATVKWQQAIDKDNYRVGLQFIR
jgi:hypothetical protein